MRAVFDFVPFGRTAPSDAVACDGLVDGAALHASHWSGNRTPPEWKADTSVEIALRAAKSGRCDGLLVTNNHFDTDGVLAVFTMLEPEIAHEHSSALMAAAELGDFDEWPANESGLKLDAAIAALAARERDEHDAYTAVLAALPDLLGQLDDRDDLWSTAVGRLLDADRRASAGALEHTTAGGIDVFVHRPGVDELPGPVLARRARPLARRWLMAFEQPNGTWSYRYERPRHAWADTVRRPTIAAPSRNAIAARLGPGWSLKAGSGMTSLLCTPDPVRDDPASVTERLHSSDPDSR